MWALLLNQQFIMEKNNACSFFHFLKPITGAYSFDGVCFYEATVQWATSLLHDPIDQANRSSRGRIYLLR